MQNKRKIMTYPFIGLDSTQIMQIAKNITIIPRDDDFDLRYNVIYCDSSNNVRNSSIVVKDQNLKYTLSYFYFLSGMIRVFFNEKAPKKNYDFFPSDNTYADIVLKVINESCSYYKETNQNMDYEDILYRFNKRYDSDDLNRLHDSESDYLYLNKLMDFLIQDNYSISISKYNKDGVYYNKISDGYLQDVVDYIIENQNDAYKMSSYEKSNDTILNKKFIKVKVI